MIYEAVIFDIDGVLLDSLAPHLQFCSDMSHEFDLGLEIPNAHDFRNHIVRAGIKISPMENFLSAVGFPPNAARKADLVYQESFADDYLIEPFPGVPDMLKILQHEGHCIGMVTSNVLRNVEQGLGDCMDFFHPDFCFAKDTLPRGSTKVEALLIGSELLGLSSDECVYIGDQWADADAANEAGTAFLGVSYGWCITEEDEDRFAIAHSVQGIANCIKEELL